MMYTAWAAIVILTLFGVFGRWAYARSLAVLGLLAIAGVFTLILPGATVRGLMDRTMSLSQTVAERELLLAREPFFTHDQVAGRYGSVAALEAARKSKRLIVGTYKGTWVYPAFQFLDTGPAPHAVARLVPHLPSEPQDGGWSAIFWCFQPHVDLDQPARRPAPPSFAVARYRRRCP